MELLDLEQLMLSIENDVNIKHEYEIAQKIQEALNPKDNTLTDEERAEHFAFNFVANYPTDSNTWGTYYGPLFVLPDETGQFKEFPGRSFVTGPVIKYWKERAAKSKNPIFINRYADLVLEFGKEKDFSLSQKVVSSAISINQNNLQDPIDIKQKLKRALDFCFGYNNKKDFDLLKVEVIKLDSEASDNNSPGLWGFALDWLVITNPKFPLSDAEIKTIVDSLEKRLASLLIETVPNLWSIECAVKELAEYYESINDSVSLERILLSFDTALRKHPNFESDQVNKGHNIENLISYFSKYSNHTFAKDKCVLLRSELGSMSDLQEMEMHTVSTEIKIPQNEIDEYLNSIFNDNATEKIVSKIAVLHILKIDSVKNQLNNIAQNHPMQFLCTRFIASEYGFNVAQYGTINENPDEHFLANFSQNISFQDPFLKMSLDRLKTSKTPAELLAFLEESPLFNESDKIYLKVILEKFYANEFLAVSSLSMPVIESAVRNLFIVNKAPYIKSNPDGGYDVKSLNELLAHQLIKDVFLTSGENVATYLKVLLVNRIGWNLRNDYAHGQNKLAFFNENVANRLVHVLLLLSLVRTKKQTFEK
jgi:hypothetical protein